MKPDQAAKVLRRYQAWHQAWRTDNNVPATDPMPPVSDITAALDAAVAALEREIYMRDVEVKRKGNHISDCACDTCTRVMRYEDALHAEVDDQRCGSCNDIHDTFTPCNNDHEDDAA